MEYFEPLKQLFERHANPVYAAGAKKYMRNLSDFYGMGAPVRREILGNFLKKTGYPNAGMLKDVVDYTWAQPQREWQYAGMEILARFARSGAGEMLPLAEYMITHKSWWDTVDYIAPNIAGVVFKKNPELIAGQVESWMNSGNLWLQRSCLLFQLKYRNEVDIDLLFGLCEKLADHKDFFIRKAIGWSLREYSKRNPVAVLEFVNTRTLSPLSRKEALKRIKG
jgi:3-methyladenine DNA glycosylase AlkD